MKRPNLYDYVKILAILTMIIDHMGFLFYPELVILRVVGRTAFPLFLFLVGYNHSYRWRSSLWIRGIVLQLLLWVGWLYGFTDIRYMNILLAIGGTRVVLQLIQRYNSYIAEACLFIICLGLSRYTYEYIDYGTLSIVFALLGYWVKKYGNTLFSTLLIFICVSYHLVFMFFTRSFGEHMLPLSLVGVILFIVMYAISKSNYSLRTSHHTYDQYIITLSSYALGIYIVQACILSLLYLVLP